MREREEKKEDDKNNKVKKQFKDVNCKHRCGNVSISTRKRKASC